MKKILIIVAVCLFAYPSFAQWDTIHEGYPYYYPPLVIPDTHWYDGVMCWPAFTDFGYQIDLSSTFWREYEVGYVADTTLHVIGLAACFRYMSTSSPFDTSWSFFIWGKITLSSPFNDRVQQVATIDLHNLSAHNASKILKYDYFWDGRYMCDGFFPLEHTINAGDTFFLSAKATNIIDPEDKEKNYAPAFCGSFEKHTPSTEERHWPTHLVRGKIEPSSPWIDSVSRGIPTVWLIIRRDEDTCPPPALYYYYEPMGENTAYVRWDNNATHAACEFSFGPAGTAPEDGTIIPSTIPQHVFSDLDPDSHYVVYARARCDFARSEWTAWSAPLDIYLAGYGIPEAEDSDGLQLSPNPAAGRVTVTLPQEAHSLTVHNVDGREVYRNDTPAETLDIDVSRWARGVYTVSVESDRGTTAKKLVVE